MDQLAAYVTIYVTTTRELDFQLERLSVIEAEAVNFNNQPNELKYAIELRNELPLYEKKVRWFLNSFISNPQIDENKVEVYLTNFNSSVNALEGYIDDLIKKGKKDFNIKIPKKYDIVNSNKKGK